MDDKTFKLTISLSVGFTVLGSTAAFLVRTIFSPPIQTTIMAIVALGVFYILAAGFVALGALRTARSYGYGTRFLLQQQAKAQEVLADALARQEQSTSSAIYATRQHTKRSEMACSCCSQQF